MASNTQTMGPVICYMGGKFLGTPGGRRVAKSVEGIWTSDD